MTKTANIYVELKQSHAQARCDTKLYEKGFGRQLDASYC